MNQGAGVGSSLTGKYTKSVIVVSTENELYNLVI